jgi:hypothetical protein
VSSTAHQLQGQGYVVCTNKVNKSHKKRRWCVQFCRWSFTDGPLGAFAIQMYKSCPCLRDSKNRTLLQLYKSASSLRWNSLDFVSSFASFLAWGINAARSFIKCRCLHKHTRRQQTRVGGTAVEATGRLFLLTRGGGLSVCFGWMNLLRWFFRRRCPWTFAL